MVTSWDNLLYAVGKIVRRHRRGVKATTHQIIFMKRSQILRAISKKITARYSYLYLVGFGQPTLIITTNNKNLPIAAIF